MTGPGTPFPDPRCTPAFRLMMATSWLAPHLRAEHQEAAIREALEAGVDWEAFLLLVDRHRTPALAHAALARSGGAGIPAQVMTALGRRGDGARKRAMGYAALLAGVLRALGAASIPAMPLKGILLSQQLYGDPTLRQSKDLDLMVPRASLEGAMGVLEGLGWRERGGARSLTPRQWRACLDHEWHVEFIHQGTGLSLELHWRNHEDTPAQTRRRWERSSPREWMGCPYQLMHPLDQVVFLCTHGACHAWFRAKWLGDVAALVAAPGQAPPWGEALAEAERAGQDRALLQALHLVDRLYGVTPPGFPASFPPLRPALLAHALEELLDPREPHLRRLSPARSFLQGARTRLYLRDLMPTRPLLEQLGALAYCRVDFDRFPLPDAWFWAYAPLRPLFWAWRHLRKDAP